MGAFLHRDEACFLPKSQLRVNVWENENPELERQCGQGHLLVKSISGNRIFSATWEAMMSSWLLGSKGIMKRMSTSLLRWGWRMQSTVPALRAWRLEFDPRHKRSGGDEIIIPVLGDGDRGFPRLAAQPDKPTQQIQGGERPCLKHGKTKKEGPGVVVHTTFNSSPGESEASGSVSSRPACVNT